MRHGNSQKRGLASGMAEFPEPMATLSLSAELTAQEIEHFLSSKSGLHFGLHLSERLFKQLTFSNFSLSLVSAFQQETSSEEISFPTLAAHPSQANLSS